LSVAAAVSLALLLLLLLQGLDITNQEFDKERESRIGRQLTAAAMHADLHDAAAAHSCSPNARWVMSSSNGSNTGG
jgi:hypothetical protein